MIKMEFHNAKEIT